MTLDSMLPHFTDEENLDVATYLQRAQEGRQLARLRIKNQQRTDSRHYNLPRRYVEYQPGDPLDETTPAAPMDQEPTPDNEDGTWFLVARKRKKQVQATSSLPPNTEPAQQDHPHLRLRNKSSQLPPLPIDDLKVVFRPRDGLNLGEWPQHSIARAIGTAAQLNESTLHQLTIRIRREQNVAVVSTPDEELARHVFREQQKTVEQPLQHDKQSRKVTTFNGAAPATTDATRGRPRYRSRGHSQSQSRSRSRVRRPSKDQKHPRARSRSGSRSLTQQTQPPKEPQAAWTKTPDHHTRKATAMETLIRGFPVALVTHLDIGSEIPASSGNVEEYRLVGDDSIPVLEIRKATTEFSMMFSKRNLR
ncbi:serine/arginine repetitive matrix protein 5-like [Dermacentor albipictus]|uniref:serine/arginine repetitive matrix protein 5-like n=1 Tax=Dermacentor albipictus TaxID=60249 RepID=UPI0038FBFDD0